MDTPTYSADIVIGGSSQSTRTAIGNCLPTLINTRQSGKIILTATNESGTAFDLTSLTNLKAYAKPYNSAETPVELGTGAISGAGNNVYTVSWVKDTFPSGWSSYPEDKEGAIVIWVEMEETGTADYYTWHTRVNVEDGTFTGDASTLPLVSLIFYYDITYEYDNTTTDADPTAGKFRLNSNTISSVTEMYISDNPKSGIDLSSYLQALVVGNEIFINNPNVKLEAGYFTVSGAPVNNVGYTTIPVTYVSAGTTPWTNGNYFSFDIKTGLMNIVEDTTPQLGGDLDAQGNNITDLGDVTFKTGATGGTLRTGVSSADKFELQGYDVDGATYVKVLEVDAGNDVTLEVFDGSFTVRNTADEAKRIAFDASNITTANTRTITMPDSDVNLGLVGSALQNVVEDTTPQLGGNLDVNGNEIQSSADLVFQLGDAVGANKLSVQDSASAEVMSVNSDGKITNIATEIAFGLSAGATSQGANAVAVGGFAGNNTQATGAVAVGYSAGQTTQGAQAVAIGNGAGNSAQSTQAVAIGQTAGQATQGTGGVAIGYLAGNNTQGNYSVSVGQSAGATSQGANGVAVGGLAGQATQGLGAIGVGYQAGNSSQSTYGVAIGYQAGQTSQGLQSIAIGVQAGRTTQALNAVAIGNNAGTTTQGAGAIGIGYLAGNSSQSANTVAIGYLAGQTNLGVQSVAVGYKTLNVSTASSNTAMGYESGRLISTGGANTAIGNQTLWSLTTGASNTALGSSTLGYVTTANFNTAVGAQSLLYISTGASNTALGRSAGTFITGGVTQNTTGSNSVFIGESTRASADGNTNEIVIGSAVTGNGSNTVTIGNSSITNNYLTGALQVSGAVTGVTDLTATGTATVGSLIIPTSGELTIATGSIAITGSRHSIDTEGDAATDDLDTITGGTVGQILILNTEDSARVVTLKDGTGNMALAGDFAMDKVNDRIMLERIASGWVEISRSNNA